MRESWKKIAGYEGFYSVSNGGRVRREVSRTCAKAGSILKPALRNGYPFVNLCRDGAKRAFSVHDLVATAFLGQRPPQLVVNHKNGIRTDCRKLNLEWGTQSHNVKEAYRLGLRDARGEGNGQAKLTTAIVLEIRSRASAGVKQAVLAHEFGVRREAISEIVRRKAWAHV